MRVPFYDLGPFVNAHKDEIMNSVEAVLSSGSFILGRQLECFEREFAEQVGVTHSIGVANGLDAIRLLLEAHGLGSGDEVIVPGYTFVATWLAVLQVGAVPVPVDVNLQDACINPDQIEGAITEKTKAILVVHLYGNSVDMSRVAAIAARHGLLVFEDASQAHMGETEMGNVGASATGGAFSLYPTKNLGALGDAGVITTNDSEVAERVISLRSYGLGSQRFSHVRLGWNSRLDEVQAAILRVFLKNLSATTERRRRIASQYMNALGFEVDACAKESTYHHFALITNSRTNFRRILADAGVESDIHYPYFFGSVPALSPRFYRPDVDFLSSSAKLASSVVTLPIGPWMSDAQVEHVAWVLQKNRSRLDLGGIVNSCM